jgi:hypothetical protein
MTLKDIKQKLEYKLRVSKEEHKKNLDLSASFFEELMDYFKYGLEDKLKLLNPEPLQIAILHYALDLHTVGTLKNTENQGRIIHNKQPYLIREYETNASFEENDRNKSDFVSAQKRASFMLEWNVINVTPHSLKTSLFEDYKSKGYLYFLFFNNIIQSPDQLTPFYSGSKRKKEDIAVYESGRRLIHSIDSKKTPFGEGKTVFNFHLIGNFNSKITKGTQFIYGFNELNDETYDVIKPFGLIEKF